MLHHAKVVGAATVMASSAVAVINEWVTVGSGMATIAAAVAALYGLRRRRRRRRPSINLDGLPSPPAKLPLTRITKDDYARQVHAWDVYQAQLEQFFKDQKGQQ